MTTTKYSKQNQETAAGPQGSFVQDDLVHLKFELFVGTSAEAYITYFCVGFPTLCQGPRNFFLYLFIYLSTREKCLSRGFYLSRKDWIPVDVFSLCIVRRPFLFSDFGFWRTYKELFLGDFCFQGKDKSFSIFTRSLRALTFQFCCGSFTINLSRKAITFVHLVCVLSFII